MGLLNLYKMFFICFAVILITANTFAENVVSEQRIAMLENLAHIGDQASIDELRRIRQAKQKKEKIQKKAKKPQVKHYPNNTGNNNPARYSATPSNPFITVEASGVGVSHDEALRDAFKDAVRKVVGIYVITQTKTTSSTDRDDLVEKIYLNADAVVTNHKILQKTEQDGVVTIRLKATVVKNDLLKYVKKNASTNISDTNIANVLNKLDMLKEAEKSLEYILKDYACKVITIKPVGDITIGTNASVPQGYINFQMDYKVEFNDTAFKNITSRLQNLLDKVAIGRKIDYANEKELHSHLLDDFRKNYQAGTQIVVFANNRNVESLRSPVRSDRGKTKQHTRIEYRIYAVHNKIYNKISSLTYASGIVFQFFLRNKKHPIIKILDTGCSLQLIDYAGCIFFRNDIDFYYESTISLNGYFKESFFMPIDDFKKIVKCTIKTTPFQDWKKILRALPDERRVEIFGKSFSNDSVFREKIDETIYAYRPYSGGFMYSF